MPVPCRGKVSGYIASVQIPIACKDLKYSFNVPSTVKVITLGTPSRRRTKSTQSRRPCLAQNQTTPPTSELHRGRGKSPKTHLQNAQSDGCAPTVWGAGQRERRQSRREGFLSPARSRIPRNRISPRRNSLGSFTDEFSKGREPPKQDNCNGRLREWTVTRVRGSTYHHMWMVPCIAHSGSQKLFCMARSIVMFSGTAFDHIPGCRRSPTAERIGACAPAEYYVT